MTVGIIGLGLIGGSIGLALRQPGNKILGYDPDPKATEVALGRQCVDRACSLAEVSEAEVVFIACPPNCIPETLEAVRNAAGESTCFTDCSSVKAEAVAWAKGRKESRFVPGHPMAGHEKSGAAYASPWLFRGAKWILCPLSHSDKGAIRLIEGVVRSMGAQPVRMDPKTHDRQVAILSHLPHIFAGILVQIGVELENSDVAAGSWRDLTRVGGVDPGLWTQILMGNRAEAIRAIEDSEAHLGNLTTALKKEDSAAVRAFFEDAAAAKEKLTPAPKPTQQGPRPAKRKGR